MGGLLALAAGIAFWIGWGPGDRPPRRVFQQSSFEASRERAARLLCESRWITEFEATTSATPHLVAQTPLAAGHARQNMERLSAVLDSMPSGNSADVSEALAAHLKLWEAPPSAEVAAILPVNTETLERSLKIVEAYAALFADLNETVQNPTPRNIDRLRAGVKNGLALPPP